MRLYTTTIKAISPLDGELKTYGGPNVPGISIETARQYCEDNGLGYCHVEGILIAEIPCKPGTYEADFDGMIDYENETIN